MPAPTSRWPSPTSGPEENPALGRRGLRLSAERPELLDAQLEALAIAAKDTGADVRVMAPMVATVEEAAWFARRVRENGLPKAGVMIEVPGAALRAAHVLAEVDFGSLGTNDLAQYTMAADRMQGELADLLDPWQPAVLDVVAAACDGARRRTGRPIGVCGESAGDPLLALVLAGLGVSSLSMAPSKVPVVRLALSLHSLPECQGLATVAREAAHRARRRSRRCAPARAPSSPTCSEASSTRGCSAPPSGCGDPAPVGCGRCWTAAGRPRRQPPWSARPFACEPVPGNDCGLARSGVRMRCAGVRTSGTATSLPPCAGEPLAHLHQHRHRGEPAGEQRLALDEPRWTPAASTCGANPNGLAQLGDVVGAVHPHEHEVVALAEDLRVDLRGALRGQQQPQAVLAALGGDLDEAVEQPLRDRAAPARCRTGCAPRR